MSINNQQKKILLTSIIIIGAMLFFPPFVTHLPNGAQSNEGFSFLFLPPKGGWSITPSVNAIQLFTQWVAVCLIGAIAFFLSGLLNHGTTTQTCESTETPILHMNAWLKLIGPFMRVGRGILVLLAVFIAIGLLTSTIQIFSMNSVASEQLDWGKFLSSLLLKISSIAILMVANRFLSKAINHIYKTQFGRSTAVILRWRDL